MILVLSFIAIASTYHIVYIRIETKKALKKLKEKQEQDINWEEGV